MQGLNKDELFPLTGYNRLCFLKNIIWWNWDNATISKNVQALTSSNINELDCPTRRDKILGLSHLNY